MRKFIVIFILLIGVFIYLFLFNNIKVSVIVPVYNTEEYLDDCLTSLKNQTLKDIEFIVINDGSNDKSFQIMQKYAQNDKRFRIFNQDNQGVGKTRNFGMLQAKGEYIGFVDSDDYVAINYFDELYKVAKKYDSDVAVIVNTIKFSDEQKQNYYTFALPYVQQRVIDSIDFMIGNLGQQWDKIYKKSFIEKYGIKSYERRVWFEDEWFSSLVALYAKKIAITDKTIYFYRHNPTGITQSINLNEKKFWEGFLLYNRLLDIIQTLSLDKNKKIKLSKLVNNKIRWYIDTYWIFGEKTEELDKYYNPFFNI
ncbi:MAG: glycosyltransferase [Alphaproteobacteria bacterium]|nr:glycosyltransferase [Alphaproteobacteria bacterium]